MFHAALDWYVRHRFELPMSLNRLYASVGISRQGVHQHRARRARRLESHAHLDALVRQVRRDQLWSSDITYFRVGDSFYYLTFVLDCFSRRILGHSVSSRLCTRDTTLAALRRAVATRRGACRGTILHSDGGGQYYADEFVRYTQAHGLVNSMCDQAWQNPYAERVNGTIKNNYLHHYQIGTMQELVKKVELAVRLYNVERPHKSLNWVAPVEFEEKLSNLSQP